MMRRRSQLEACMQLAMSRSAYQIIYPRYLVILGIFEGMTRKLDLDAEETCNFRHYIALRNGNLNKKPSARLNKGPPAGRNVGSIEDSGASVIGGAWLCASKSYYSHNHPLPYKNRHQSILVAVLVSVSFIWFFYYVPH